MTSVRATVISDLLAHRGWQSQIRRGDGVLRYGGGVYGVGMPTYVFRCPDGCPDFSERHPMAGVPDTALCPACSEPARRMVGAPALGMGGSAAMRAQDRTRATADTPDVVTSLPPSRRSTPVTTNPLHRKLPRP